jgi:hypothetical protein
VDYDKTDMARSYDLGRGYSTAQLNRWLAVVARWVHLDCHAAAATVRESVVEPIDFFVFQPV